MNAPFEGLVTSLTYGPYRWFLMFNLEKSRTDKIVAALDQMASSAFELRIPFDDFSIYENDYPDALLIPDHAWKLLTDPVVTPLLEGASSAQLARFSEDQMRILAAIALPMSELVIILQDAYALMFDILFNAEDEALGSELMSPQTFKKINRFGCASLDHGTNLHEHFRTEEPSEVEDEDEDEYDDDDDDEYGECENCGERVSHDSLTRGYCEDCCSYCTDCGDLTPDNELTDGYCEGCMDHCSDCGERVPREQLNDDNHCNCCAENYTECVECGEVYHNDDLDENDMCEGCVQNQVDRVGG